MLSSHSRHKDGKKSQELTGPLVLRKYKKILVKQKGLMRSLLRPKNRSPDLEHFQSLMRSVLTRGEGTQLSRIILSSELAHKSICPTLLVVEGVLQDTATCPLDPWILTRGRADPEVISQANGFEPNNSTIPTGLEEGPVGDRDAWVHPGLPQSELSPNGTVTLTQSRRIRVLRDWVSSQLEITQS